MPASDEQRAYFDCAATTPFDERLREVLEGASWANANSLYAEGRKAAQQLRNARARIARTLHAHAPSEIVFTSGGTESDNTGIIGLTQLSKPSGSHVVVSAIEHHAVLHAADSLKARGYKVDKVNPNAEGLITPDSLEDALSRIEAQGDSCALVCVQWVNNEIGTIQPVQELARIAHEHDARFFCDAVQALGKLPIDLETLGVDACAFSAHKIGSTKGFGVLYLRRTNRIAPLLHGGGQESGLRSGTSNVPSACSFAQAIEYAEQERVDTWEHVSDLRERMIAGISHSAFPHDIHLTVETSADVVPHILSLRVDGLEGETVVMRSDDAGFAISAGSACTSSSLDPSHVLTALGLARDQALGGIRLSFDKRNSEEEVDRFLVALPGILR